MKYLAIIAISMICLLPHSVYAEELNESIKLNFALDEKDWEVGWSNKSDEVYILEFVPKGQTVENWKELITFEFFPGMQKQVNCMEFAEGFLKLLRKGEPNTKVMYYTNKPDNVVLEWLLNDSTKQPDQDEIDRIMIGEQGMHMVHYVKKTKSLTDAERTKWLEFVKSATLVKEK